MRIFTGRWGILIREEEIERGVRELLKEEGGDIMPTVAEQWIERGIQQGIQQGILDTSRAALIEGPGRPF